MEVVEMIPVIKEVKPITFLYFRTETTVSELSKFTSVATELFKEAVRFSLPITGPIHWHYFGFSGVEKSFTLEVALPVAGGVADYDGSFHFKRTGPFRCASIIHDGSWSELPLSYEKLMKFVKSQGVHPTGINREIYVNADFDHPEANVTEIQIGLTEA